MTAPAEFAAARGRTGAAPDHKGFTDGTHRIVAPAATLRHVEPRLAKAGVTRLADVTGLDRIGLPVAMAVRPGSRNLSILQGKGRTRDAALASAAMEAIELHAAERAPRRARWLAPRAIERPDRLLPAHVARRRIDPDAAMPWLRGIELGSGRAMLVPEELVLADFCIARPRGHRWFAPNTNGLAAGNTQAEAILHALCEVIERDALALFRLAGMPAACAVRPASVDDPACRAALDRFAAAGHAVALWDIASDIGVPAFLCEIDDYPGGRPPFLGRFAGTGCHPDAGVALLRALHEAAQSRLAVIVGARDDIAPGDYGTIGWSANLASLLDRRPPVRPVRDFGVCRSFATPTLSGDIAAVLARLAAAKVGPVVAVDLTSPDVGVPVVRVLAPGLEGMQHKAGYRPGARARRLLGRRR